MCNWGKVFKCVVSTTTGMMLLLLEEAYISKNSPAGRGKETENETIYETEQ